MNKTTIFMNKELYFSKKIQKVRYRKLHLKTNKINKIKNNRTKE